MLFKVCLLGDGAVGKTALRKRYMGEGFVKDYMMTIGTDFSVKDIKLPWKNKTVSIKYQIWDLAGQQRFQEVRSTYYLGIQGALVVFDVTRPETLENIIGWLGEMKKHSGGKDLPFIIIGNKTDLRRRSTKKRKSKHITSIKAKKFIKENIDSEEATYIETSAKTGKNVEEAFITLGKKIVENLPATVLKTLK